MNENPYEGLSQKELTELAKKNIRRIKRFIRNAEKRGYTFSNKAVPTLPKNVTAKTVLRFSKITPKKLYESAVYTSPEGTKIEGRKARVQEYWRASEKAAKTRKAFAADRKAKASPEPKPGKKAEIDTVVRMPKESKIVIEETRSIVNSLDDLQFVLDNREINERWWEHARDPLGNYKETDYGLLRGALESAIREEGEEAVSLRIQENATRISELVTAILYESGDKYHNTGRTGMNEKIQEIATLLRGRPLNSRESMEITTMGERSGIHEA